jgi:hypothetical protein
VLKKRYAISSIVLAALILSSATSIAGNAISDAFEDTFGHNQIPDAFEDTFGRNKIPNAFNDAFGGGSRSTHHKAGKVQTHSQSNQ